MTKRVPEQKKMVCSQHIPLMMVQLFAHRLKTVALKPIGKARAKKVQFNE